MSAYKNRMATGIIIAVVLGAALIAGVSYLPLNNGTRSADTEISSCMLTVPMNATIDTFQNSTLLGYLVTFANESKTVFPEYGCPVPVHPDLYAIASVIMQNNSFIKAEDRTSIPVTPFIGGYSTKVNGTTLNYAVLQFFLFTDHKIYPCGSGGYWIYQEKAHIQVTVQIDGRGNYFFSNMTIWPSAPYQSFCTTTSAVTNST